MKNETTHKASTAGPDPSPPLRLWPGVLIVALQWLSRFGLPVVAPDAVPYAMIGGLAGGLFLIIWWLFFSRAAWGERLAGVGLMIVALAGTRALLHESLATAGMGFLFFIFAAPFVSLAFVGWAVIRARAARPSWALLALLLAVSCLVWTLVRIGGVSNLGAADFAWRWTKTPEEVLLATDGEPESTAADIPSPALPETPPEWPGFRGPARDGVIAGVSIDTDWAASPPVERWRQPVGPGWSSFAVHGAYFYTQEQRGDREFVSCYSLETGEPVWRHGTLTRFWEANAGAGPRATPTLHDGRVYAFGATGTLSVVDAADGSLIWSRDVAADTDVDVPTWGFSSSPLVVGDLVIVAAVGKLAAYDTASGESRWFGPDGGDGYSSPHLLSLGGVQQVLLLSRAGAVSMLPGDGSQVWKYDWEGRGRIVQPALTADGDLLLSRGETTGLRRVAVDSGPDGWTVEERWSTRRLKPYFSDFVVHRGHAYGFDGNILAAIDVESGDRAWKGGRYGSGQLILLSDQDLLLVIAEMGDMVLVSATPDGFRELARTSALDGKTWNHPVLVGDLLLVRNDEEMVAFRLRLEP